MEFGKDLSKWFIGRGAWGVWHVFPPVDDLMVYRVNQFDSGAQAIAAFNRGHR